MRIYMPDPQMGRGLPAGPLRCSYRKRIALAIQETAQYTAYRRSKRLLSGTSVTLFLCPVVRKVSGESAGAIHEFGSREP